MPTDLRVRKPSVPDLRATPAFAALRTRNYRIYLTGQSLTNAGTWMQSVAIDWLTLTLTHSSTAVGLTMALQFLPMLLLGAYGGLIADRFPKRRLLLTTQTAYASLTTVLAALTLSGAVHATDVYLFALASGLVMVVDGPTRQAFVTEVVGSQHLRAAISLNAAVFQTTRLVGPAVSAVLIQTIGTGWVFVINAVCYVGPTVGLLRLDVAALDPVTPAVRERGALRAAGRYVLARPRVAWTIFLVGVVGTFGLNFPVVLTAMAKHTFHGNAGTYGAFNIALAVGSVAGALLAGARPRSGLRLIVLGTAAFGLAQLGAAGAPDLATFMVLLALMGMTNLALQSMANASVQLWVDPAVRGRVMGMYLLAFTGGTPIGAPLVGAITSAFGARVGMGLCGLVPAVAAVLVAVLQRGGVTAPVTARAAT